MEGTVKSLLVIAAVSLARNGALSSVCKNLPLFDHEGTVCLSLNDYLHKFINATAKGEKGSSGKIGPKGEQGEVGREGRTGLQGIQGDDSSIISDLFMSPSWLQMNARFVEAPTYTGVDYIGFSKGRPRRQIFQSSILSSGKAKNCSNISVNFQFWYDRVSTLNCLLVGLCDKTNCVGFEYADNGVYYYTWTNPPPDDHCYQNNHGMHRWPDNASNRATITFDMTDSQTIAMTWSHYTDHATLYTSDIAIDCNNGLWIMGCRYRENDSFRMRFFQTQVKINKL